MQKVELEQLKNDVETKVGVLALAIKRGEVQDDSAGELIELFEDYEENGTNAEELRMLHEDVQFALQGT